MSDLTPNQRVIFNLLRDGYAHSKNEFRSLLDEYMADNAIEVAVHFLRKKINPSGLDIVGRNGGYQMVRLLHSAYDGKR